MLQDIEQYKHWARKLYVILSLVHSSSGVTKQFTSLEKMTLKSSSEKTAPTVSISWDCWTCSIRKPGTHPLPNNPSPQRTNNHKEEFNHFCSASILLFLRNRLSAEREIFLVQIMGKAVGGTVSLRNCQGLLGVIHS